MQYLVTKTEMDYCSFLAICYFDAKDVILQLFLDHRMRDYLLMQSPIEMTLILLGYIFFALYAGPRYMANRKPFNLKTAMIVYNFTMVSFNAYIVYEVSGWIIYLQRNMNILYLDMFAWIINCIDW